MTNVETTGQSDHEQTSSTSESVILGEGARAALRKAFADDIKTLRSAERRHLPPQQPSPPLPLATATAAAAAAPPSPSPPPPTAAAAAAAAAATAPASAAATAAESFIRAGTIPLYDADMSAGRKRMILRLDIAGNVATRNETVDLL